MAENSQELNLHFLDYWRVVRNRLPIILTIFLLTFMSGYVTTVYFLPKVYAASAEIRVKKERQIDVFQQSVYENQFNAVEFESEKETLTSKKMLFPVIQELKLQKAWAQRIFKMQGDTEVPVEDAYLYLKNAVLEIDAKRGSNLIEITSYSEDPQEAADISNTLARLYIELRKSEEGSKHDSGLFTLRKQIEEQEAVVKTARDKADKIRDEGKIDINQNSMVRENELMLKIQLLEQENKDLENWRTQLEQLKGLSPEKALATLQAFALADNNMQNLQQQQFSLESEIEKLNNKGYLANHPEVQSLVSSLKKVKEQLLNSIEGKVIALKGYERSSQIRVQQLEAAVKEMKETLRKERTDKFEPYTQAKEDAERKQIELDTLTARYKQISVDTSIGSEPATVNSPASAPPLNRPAKPNLFLNLVLSSVVGLVLGFGLAFFIEYLDTSVKTMDDVEKFLGLPVLAVIPQGILPLNHDEGDSPNAEPYRILRAKMDLTPHESFGRSITVVSGGPGEGKSTTLFNLAYVCAQSGQSVLLIDADLRRPTLHKILGIENNRGVADVMTERAEAAELIMATSAPNLHVLTAGDMPMELMGAVSSVKIREMLHDLKQRYDVVLIDSPPILGISDGSVIAHEVDATLLVIQHRRYPRDIAARAKRAIDEIRGNLVGVVLNAVAIKSDEAYYYYSTYTQYYSKNGKRKKADSATVARKQAAIRVNNERGSESF